MVVCVSTDGQQESQASRGDSEFSRLVLFNNSNQETCFFHYLIRRPPSQYMNKQTYQILLQQFALSCLPGEGKKNHEERGKHLIQRTHAGIKA